MFRDQAVTPIDPQGYTSKIASLQYNQEGREDRRERTHLQSHYHPVSYLPLGHSASSSHLLLDNQIVTQQAFQGIHMICPFARGTGNSRPRSMLLPVM